MKSCISWAAAFLIVFVLALFVVPQMAAAEPVDLSVCSVSMPAYFDNATAGPGTQPSTLPLMQPETSLQRSVAEFIGHFSAYEPMYFIAGPVDPLVKFQLSFKYKLFNDEAPLARAVPLLSGLHFSYTQLSLWQLTQPTSAFYDTNYKPEFFFSNEDINQFKLPLVSQFGLQTGIGHESNGRGNADERAINYLFLRPIFDFGDVEKFHFYIAPKAYVYIFSLSDNPDIQHYRGYCDLRSVVGWRQGLELSFLGRIGSNYNKGSVQFDLTYPIRDLLDHNLDLYLDLQYFNGYGESLIDYNHRTSAFRVGFALAR
jgi:outer membrane phospholipase A